MILEVNPTVSCIKANSSSPPPFSLECFPGYLNVSELETFGHVIALTANGVNAELIS